MTQSGWVQPTSTRCARPVNKEEEGGGCRAGAAQLFAARALACGGRPAQSMIGHKNEPRRRAVGTGVLPRAPSRYNKRREKTCRARGRAAACRVALVCGGRPALDMRESERLTAQSMIG
eukprot:15642652-Heterocapsa_arctica.AAC.2